MPTNPQPNKAPRDINVLVILDMSGSMAGKEKDTIGGVNSFIDQAKADQLKEGGKVTFALTCFDTEFLPVIPPTPIQQVKHIGPAEYTPRGATALLDAVGLTLSPLRFSEDEAVMVLITTDGEENSSREWTAPKVKALIEEREKKGWEFMFLGIGLDAWEVSQNYSTAAMRQATVSTRGDAMVDSLNFAATAYMSVKNAGGSVAASVADAYKDPANRFVDRTVKDKRPAAGKRAR